MHKKILSKFKKLVKDNSLIPVASLINIERKGDIIYYKANNLDTFILYKESVDYEGEDFSASVNGKEFLSIASKIVNLKFSLSSTLDIVAGKNIFHLQHVLTPKGEPMQINIPNIDTQTIATELDVTKLKKANTFAKDLVGNLPILNTVLMTKDSLISLDSYTAFKGANISTTEVVLPENFIKLDPENVSVGEDLIWEQGEDYLVISYISNHVEDYPTVAKGLFENIGDDNAIIEDISELKDNLSILKGLKDRLVTIYINHEELKLQTNTGLVTVAIRAEVSKTIQIDINLMASVINQCSGEVELNVKSNALYVKNGNSEYVVAGFANKKEG